MFTFFNFWAKKQTKNREALLNINAPRINKIYVHMFMFITWLRGIHDRSISKILATPQVSSIVYISQKAVTEYKIFVVGLL